MAISASEARKDFFPLVKRVNDHTPVRISSTNGDAVVMSAEVARRIARLIAEIQRTPFTNIGKPESLKGDLPGYWSRLISDEHRLVHRVDEKEVKILKARYHC
ncbi:Txe/YoeB family addiction module toxin [Streptomyces sp. NPDC050264]|uniref:Txe/YoeB family addiction module toxin n=1 Tax=Streptomyces sp. NPDC050264 TaxID=3155038 RepID=UPI00343B9E1F